MLATSHCCHIFNYYHHKLQSRASPPVELSITRLPLLSSYHLLASRACVLRATAVIFLLVTIIKSHRREPTPVEPSHLYALACHIIITSVRATSHCRHIFNYYHHKLQSRASPPVELSITRLPLLSSYHLSSSRACVLRATAVIYLITIITSYSREPSPPVELSITRLLLL